MNAFFAVLPEFQFAEKAFDWESDSIGFYNKYASLFGIIGLMYLQKLCDGNGVILLRLCG